MMWWMKFWNHWATSVLVRPPYINRWCAGQAVRIPCCWELISSKQPLSRDRNIACLVVYSINYSVFFFHVYMYWWGGFLSFLSEFFQLLYMLYMYMEIQCVEKTLCYRCIHAFSMCIDVMVGREMPWVNRKSNLLIVCTVHAFATPDNLQNLPLHHVHVHLCVYICSFLGRGGQGWQFTPPSPLKWLFPPEIGYNQFQKPSPTPSILGSPDSPPEIFF